MKSCGNTVSLGTLRRSRLVLSAQRSRRRPMADRRQPCNLAEPITAPSSIKLAARGLQEGSTNVPERLTQRRKGRQTRRRATFTTDLPTSTSKARAARFDDPARKKRHMLAGEGPPRAQRPRAAGGFRGQAAGRHGRAQQIPRAPLPQRRTARRRAARTEGRRTEKADNQPEPTSPRKGERRGSGRRPPGAPGEGSRGDNEKKSTRLDAVGGRPLRPPTADRHILSARPSHREARHHLERSECL